MTFIKAFGQNQSHHFEICKLLLLESCSSTKTGITAQDEKSISKIIHAFIRKFSGIPLHYQSIQQIIPDITNKLLERAQSVKETECLEIILGAYGTLISCVDNNAQQGLISPKFLDLSLELCVNLLNQIKAESASINEERPTEESTEFETCEEEPEDGALENLFENDGIQDTSFKRIKTVRKIFSLLGQEHLSLNISFEKLKLIMQVANNIDVIMSRDYIIGVRSNSNLSTIKINCKNVIFPAVVSLSLDELFELINANDGIISDFDNEFELVVFCRYVYNSINSNKTEWFDKFVTTQIEFIAASETITSDNINFAFTIYLLMIANGNIDRNQLISSIFLNLCSSATVSTQNTIQLLVLFDHLISNFESKTVYSRLVLGKLDSFLDPDEKVDIKNFEEIQNLSTQSIAPLISPNNLPADDKIVSSLKTSFESLDEMFCIIVESIMAQKSKSKNIMIFIILAKRIIKKLNVKTSSKIVQLICEEKVEDDQERNKFLMQYTESIISNAEVDLLLLSITLTELTAAGILFTDSVKDFLYKNMAKLLKLCETFLLDYVYEWAKDENAFLDELKCPPEMITLFLPFGRLTDDIECLKAEDIIANSLEMVFQQDYLLPPGSMGASIFSVLANHGSDHEHIYIYNILNVLSEALGCPTEETRLKYSNSFDEAHAILKSSLVFMAIENTLFSGIMDAYADRETNHNVISERIATSIKEFMSKSSKYNEKSIQLALDGFLKTLSASPDDTCLENLEVESAKDVVKFLLTYPETFASLFDTNIQKCKEFLTEHSDQIFDDNIIELLISAIRSWSKIVTTEETEETPSSKIQAAKRVIGNLTNSFLNEKVFKMGFDALESTFESNDNFSFFDFMIKLANNYKDETNQCLPHSNLVQWATVKIEKLLVENQSGSFY